MEQIPDYLPNCGESFTTFEFHAYAEQPTQKTTDGADRTTRVWAEMERQGVRVEHDPEHFVTKAAERPRLL